MIFKNFDVDYDKIAIDEIIMVRPSYIGIKAWLDFWEFAQNTDIHGTYSKSIEETQAQSFQEGKEESEKEHQIEFEDQIRNFDRSIQRAITRIEGIASFYEIQNDEFIEKMIEALYEAIPQ